MHLSYFLTMFSPIESVLVLLFGLLVSFPISIQSSRHSPNPSNGTRWAVLVAGSNSYENYRHQSDVCHAYQILKRGGLKDENIIVFMYDDIAFNENNPQPGIIINHPEGPDVYKGVPKDYTGDKVTKENFYAVLLGNKTGLTGGSGKVLKSGPNDHVFIFYTDHGSPGFVGMPVGDNVYAHELNYVLKKMHDAQSYKTLLFYLEACEAGSMFDGMLPEGLNIYATTASNSAENSYAYYCPDDDELSYDVNEYDTCLGDLYSISWMEDTENHDMGIETLKQQYEVVKKKTKDGGDEDIPGSHVMQYGNLKISATDTLSTYMGSNRVHQPYTTFNYSSTALSRSRYRNVNQRDADLLHFMYKLRNSPRGSFGWIEAKNRVSKEMKERNKVDISMKNIVQHLFGINKMKTIFESTRPHGQPLVNNWHCFKESVKTYQEECGTLSNYGRKYTRVLANMCNAGVKIKQLAKAAAEACRGSSS